MRFALRSLDLSEISQQCQYVFLRLISVSLQPHQSGPDLVPDMRKLTINFLPKKLVPISTCSSRLLRKLNNCPVCNDINVYLQQ